MTVEEALKDVDLSKLPRGWQMVFEARKDMDIQNIPDSDRYMIYRLTNKGGP